MPRWPAPPRQGDYPDGAFDGLEFRKAGRRLPHDRRGASRPERGAKRRSRCRAGADPGQSCRRSRCSARGHRACEAWSGQCRPAAATAAMSNTDGDEVMAKGFASTSDMAEKKVTFSEVGARLYAFTA